MARSKVSTPSGKKVTPKKKRDQKARASIKIESKEISGRGYSSNSRKVTKKNDGDPTVYRKHTSIKKGPKSVNKTTTTSTRRSKAAANPVKGGRKGVFGIGGAKKTTETSGGKNTSGKSSYRTGDPSRDKHLIRVEAKMAADYEKTKKAIEADKRKNKSATKSKTTRK